MKASEWIDRVKAKNGWDSDYRVAKELHLSRQAVSDYRSKTVSMDEGTAIKVAAAFGVPPTQIILDQVAERSHNPQVKAELQAISSRLYIM